MDIYGTNVTTGVGFERNYTQKELDNIADNDFIKKLCKKVIHLYPAAESSDVIFENTGSGVVIVYWNTAKLGAQPAIATIDAVSDVNGEAANENKIREKKFNKDIIKAIGLTMKDFMNEIMAGRTTRITNSELKAKFKSHL